MSEPRRLSPLFTWRSAIVESTLTSTQRHVALTLSLHMNERGGSCFPTHEQLQEETGLGRSTVIAALKALEEAGWLIRRPGGGRRRGGNGQATEYSATVPLLDGSETVNRPPGGQNRPAAGHQDDIQDATDQEQSPPSPPGGELDAVHPANRPSKVNRKAVTDGEYERASAILAAFNRHAGTRYGSKDYISKIVSRIREHPELDVHAHAVVIYRSLAAPWWSGPPSPSVIYGNESLFERCVHAAASTEPLPDRALTPEEIRTFGTVWGPGTAYETLAEAQAAPQADFEVEPEDVSDDD